MSEDAFTEVVTKTQAKAKAKAKANKHVRQTPPPLLISYKTGAYSAQEYSALLRRVRDIQFPYRSMDEEQARLACIHKARVFYAGRCLRLLGWRAPPFESFNRFLTERLNTTDREEDASTSDPIIPGASGNTTLMEEILEDLPMKQRLPRARDPGERKKEVLQYMSRYYVEATDLLDHAQQHRFLPADGDAGDAGAADCRRILERYRKPKAHTMDTLLAMRAAVDPRLRLLFGPLVAEFIVDPLEKLCIDMAWNGPSCPLAAAADAEAAPEKDKEKEEGEGEDSKEVIALTEQRTSALLDAFESGGGGGASFQDASTSLIVRYFSLTCENAQEWAPTNTPSARVREKHMRPRNWNGSGSQSALPDRLYQTLRENYGAELECFSSPLNHTFAQKIAYCSLFDADRAFGSLGSFWSVPLEQGVCVAYPPFESNLLRRAIGHMVALLAQAERRRQSLTFVLFAPSWSDPPFEPIESARKSAFCRRAFLLDMRDHVFINPSQHLAGRHIERGAFFDTLVLVLTSQTAVDDFWSSDRLRALESDVRTSMQQGGRRFACPPLNPQMGPRRGAGASLVPP